MSSEQPASVSAPVPFPTVLNQELAQIDERREQLGLGGPPPVPPEAPPEQAARERRLVGLAFSGGGIRSATFNLGLLQGLARLGLLRYIDYLSTVSGGGYVGAWLAAWVRRGGGLRAVERRLRANRDTPLAGPDVGQPPVVAAGVAPPDGRDDGKAGERTSGGEPEAVRHLRRYSNYLAPRQGFLSADRWVLWATYLRNFLLCQLVILPATVAVLLVARLAMVLYHPLDGWDTPPLWQYVAADALIGVLWLSAFVLLIRGARRVRPRSPEAEACPAPATGRAESEEDRPRPGEMTPRGMLAPVLLLTLSAVLFCWFVPYPLPWWPRAEPNETPPAGRGWVELAAFAGFAALVVGAGYLAAARNGRGRTATRLLAACAAGLIWGGLLYGAYLLLNGLFDWNGQLARDYIRARAAAQLTTFGPPVVLATMVLGFYVGVGLPGRRLREELREWWSAVCARLLIVAALWLSVALVALYGTALVLWAGPWMRAALASGWVLTVAAGVLAGGGAVTGNGNGRRRHPAREWLARLAPHVFVAGLLVAVSLLIHVVIDNPPLYEKANDSVWSRDMVPDRPPQRITEVTVRRRGEAGASRQRTDVVQREEVIDEGGIVEQMYWLGMLNASSNHIPKEVYRLTKWDLDRLKRDGVDARTLKKLEGMLRPREKEMTRQEFFTELDRVLPADTPYRHRVWVIQNAKVVESIKFNRAKVLVKLLLWLVLCAGVTALAARFVDINLFSLHAAYGNRLVRAYLGASRPGRTPDAVTELDPDDDLRLAALRVGAAEPGDGPAYDGPFLIVNAAMNLVRGDRLDWQERKAESFALTPLYCGSESTRYRPTEVEGADPPRGYGGNVTLGTAVTVSGAAASPNMGYHSSPSVTALLTVFNARLGAWLGNPASPTRWNSPGPDYGFAYLFRELFGMTRAKGGYVYLSDGGHFENLGVYELVRRRCRYIIVADAGRDGGHAFEDLGNLIRKVRVDFGIRIQIELGSVRLDAGRHSRWHCAVGKVRYDDVDRDAVPGTLVYLKPSLTGDEPADVLHYAEDHPDFPHESTGDQFFSESQFESYRMLGEHVAESVFARAVGDVREAEREHERRRGGEAPLLHFRSLGDFGSGGAPAPAPGERHRWRCRELFSSVIRRWFAMPAEYEATFLRSTENYVAIQETLRNDPRLWRLSLDLYPELAPAPAGLHARVQARQHAGGAAGAPEESPREQALRRSAELHAVAQMFQAMENAWMSLNLEANYAHPLNRGWMDVFHRWTSARAVREHWPLLRAEFGRAFVSFCERQMRMGVIAGRVERLCGDAVPPPLPREFREQWPDRPRLEDRLEAARSGAERLAWLVYSSGVNPPPDCDDPASVPVPCGIILVSPDGGPDATAPATSEVSKTSEVAGELFVWMRGAYRNTGLGRTAVGQVLAELRELWPGAFRLRVRMPAKDLTGPGGKLQRGMWLTFFHHYDFSRVYPGRTANAAAAGKVPLESEGPEEEADVVLERNFPAREPAPADDTARLR